MTGTTTAVVRRFNVLDFHDDAVKSIKISGFRTSANPTRIDFELVDDSTRATKLLSFRGCANVRLAMDFDVLASNWFAQTESTVSESDGAQMKKFILSQRAHWRTKYMPPSPKDKPIRKKLKSIAGYTLFRIAFFGGTVDVLAKNFALRRTN